MTEDVTAETGEQWMDHTQQALALQITNAILMRLVESMALAIPRERLAEDERAMLDQVLGRP